MAPRSGVSSFMFRNKSAEAGFGMNWSSSPAFSRRTSLMADSYPTRADLFKKWSEAMLRGAIVGKPNYSQQRQQGKGQDVPYRSRKRFRKRKRRIRRRQRWKNE